MGTFAGVGRSSGEPDARAAGASSARAARHAWLQRRRRDIGVEADILDPDAARRLEETPFDLVIVLATTGFDQDALLAGVRDVVTDSPLVGFSAEGIITTGGSVEGAYDCAVLAITSDEIDFDLAAASLEDGPDACAETLREQLAFDDTDERHALIVFADGLDHCVGEALDVLADEIPDDVPVFGGTAGDMMVFEKTYQYRNDDIYSNHVVLVHAHGQFDVDVEVAHGCIPVGLDHEVTRSDGYNVYEIDERPAWELVREYVELDEEAPFDGGVTALISVAQLLPEDSGTIIRSPVRLDRETGALFFPGGLPQGARVHLTRRTTESIRSSALASAQAIAERHPKRQPTLVLQFDCAGRGRVLLGNATSDAVVRPVQRVLGPGTAWLGCHTYGEIAPVNGRPFYHNFTAVLAAFYTDDPD